VARITQSRETIERALAILPGTNCGVCGMPGGCAGFAREYVHVRGHGGTVPWCPPGGDEVAQGLGLLAAIARTGEEARIAACLCQGVAGAARDRFQYAGIQDCRAAAELWGGNRVCRHACLALGTCVSVCPQDAIRLEDGVPVVNESRCDGCGVCVEACPRMILTLIPQQSKVYFACRISYPPEARDSVCTRGCDLCGICVQTCPYEAVSIEGKLPRIDYGKCRACGICVYQCPTRLFVDRVKVRPTSFIGTECNGCGLCLTWCTRGAISGQPNKQHRVDRQKCVGCGLCFERCPRKAVTMFGALGYVRE
jgi:electron transport complex protein RnfB